MRVYSVNQRQATRSSYCHLKLASTVKDTIYYISIQTDPYGKINLIFSISATSVITASDQQPAVYNTPAHKKIPPSKNSVRGNEHHKTLPSKQSLIW